MKCPLLSMGLYPDDTAEQPCTGDCLQAKCAWWVDKYSMCAVLGIAADLEVISAKMREVSSHDKGK